jgi:hypothetical protein
MGKLYLRRLDVINRNNDDLKAKRKYRCIIIPD